MTERRDHTFVDAEPQPATVCFDPMPLAQFNVVAEPENVARTAKLCYLSWMLGPGVKIYIRNG